MTMSNVSDESNQTKAPSPSKGAAPTIVGDDRTTELEELQKQHGGCVVVISPTSIDVMCGTGHEKQHSGNELFKRIVSQFIEPYAFAQLKKEKMQITKTILGLLTQRGVRFLKKSSICDYWYIAESKVARDKIGHFLRLHVPKNNENGGLLAAHRSALNQPIQVLSSVAPAYCYSTSPFAHKQHHQKSAPSLSLMPRRAAAPVQATTPLAQFLGGVDSSSSTAPTSSFCNSVENNNISSVWANIMEGGNQQKSKPEGGYDYSRSEYNTRPQQQVASNQVAGASSGPPLSNGCNTGVASSHLLVQHPQISVPAAVQSLYAPNSVFSKTKSEPLFSKPTSGSPSSPMRHAAGGNQHQQHQDYDMLSTTPYKKDNGRRNFGENSTSFQKTAKVEEALRFLPKESDYDMPLTASYTSKNEMSSTLFDDSLPGIDLWGGAPNMIPPSPPHTTNTSNTDGGWSRLSWSSSSLGNTFGSSNSNRNNKAADAVNADDSSMEDLFDECELAMRLD